MSGQQTAKTVNETVDQTVNEVVLVGRLGAAVDEREMPSGDAYAVFRLVVDRPPGPARPGVRVPTLDTIDCVAWPAGLRRTLRGWAKGDVVRVDGALRRRFWQTPGGPASRYEVEVTRVKRLSRAA